MKELRNYRLIFCMGMGDHPERDKLREIVKGPRQDGQLAFVRDDHGYFYVVDSRVSSALVADLRTLLGTGNVVRHDPLIQAATLQVASRGR